MSKHTCGEVAWRGIALGALASVVLGLAACAVELQNTQPARELAQENRPLGTVYPGWRIFQDKCAGCHGPAATGTPGAPNLLPLVRDMGPRQFVSVVLKRYDWGLPEARGEGKAREALIDGVLQRQGRPLSMPAWQGEPSVNVHIMDLYAFLSARAQGQQGPDRPAP
jgi:mono/diheme cytochrome c family protein